MTHLLPPKERLNPFYRASVWVPSLVRRQFLGLMALSFGWVVLRGAEPAVAEVGKGKGKGGKGGKAGGEDSSRARGPVFSGDYVLPAALAEFDRLSVVLGRASDKSVTASLLAKDATEVILEVGIVSGKYTRKIGPLSLVKGEPTEVLIDKLTPNTLYFYRLQSRKGSAGAFVARAECRFSTQRSPGASFTFTVQGDSHPERPQSSHPELYALISISASGMTLASIKCARSPLRL